MTTNPLKAAMIATALLSAGALGACAPNISANTVTAAQTGQAQRTTPAQVVSARYVQVEGTRSGIGAAAGAAAGGIGGSYIGGSTRTNVLGALGGGLAGGIVGGLAEQAVTQQQGIEYVLRTNDGRTITLVQGADVVFQPGARVLIAEGGGRSRLIPDSGNLGATAAPAYTPRPVPVGATSYGPLPGGGYGYR